MIFAESDFEGSATELAVTVMVTVLEGRGFGGV
jgi:hypothetical protein